jgi:aminoglycoside phosphotransferase (APT) family kinase protein
VSEHRADPAAQAARRARSLARATVTHHFGTAPARVIRRGGGLTNHVFLVQHAEGTFVVRIGPEAAKINAFLKEQWAMAKAREAGVPTAEVLEVGATPDGLPFMISRCVAGTEATELPDRPSTLRELGRHAARINAIRTSGFGDTFDWSGNLLSRNERWKDYLEDELELDARLEILAKHGGVAAPRLRKIRTLLRGEALASAPPALAHGDLRLKNVILQKPGEIVAIIDWEHCLSTPPPYWELSIALHDLSIDEKEAFLAGYGLDDGRMLEVAQVVKAMNLANYAPELERLHEAKDAAGVARFRLRLAATLDLYAL